MPDYVYPLSRIDLSGHEIAYALEALRAGDIGPSGRFREDVESRFARQTGAYAALTTTSGTTALHLAIDIAGIEPGDEVILPSLTYVATANAVWQAGGKPVFADLDPETWCLDPASVAERITPRTRGIVTVHLFGHATRPTALQALAQKHGLWLVADAAHAALTRLDGVGVGALTETTAFSFHLNKSITCGEGGAVTVSNPADLERGRIRRSHGMDYRKRFVFHDFGFNYRLSNLHCAILSGQFDRCDEIRVRRAAIGRAYRSALADCDEIRLQPTVTGLEQEVWMLPLLVGIRPRRSLDDLISQLAARGIEARRFFQPLHTLPFYRPFHDPRQAPLPVTEEIAARGLCLPAYNGLTPDDATAIAEHLLELVQPVSAAAGHAQRGADLDSRRKA